jgi:hypothetical protein
VSFRDVATIFTSIGADESWWDDVLMFFNWIAT